MKLLYNSKQQKEKFALQEEIWGKMDKWIHEGTRTQEHGYCATVFSKPKSPKTTFHEIAEFAVLHAIGSNSTVSVVSAFY